MTQPHPVTSELSGKQWSEGRKEFEKQARAYAAAENYEIASAIADRAPEFIHAAMTDSRTPPAACPSGWQLVPKRMTQEMELAAGPGPHVSYVRGMYARAIAAAPPPSASAEGKAK